MGVTDMSDRPFGGGGQDVKIQPSGKMLDRDALPKDNQVMLRKVNGCSSRSASTLTVLLLLYSHVEGRHSVLWARREECWLEYQPCQHSHFASKGGRTMRGCGSINGMRHTVQLASRVSSYTPGGRAACSPYLIGNTLSSFHRYSKFLHVQGTSVLTPISSARQANLHGICMPNRDLT